MIELKILLADSDRVFLELGKTFLRKTGVKVLSCTNGGEAVEIVRKESPNLVFLSTNMAFKNGLECLQSIKMNETSKNIPVVMLATSGCDEAIEKFRLAECDEVILKPVSQHTFLGTVKKFLDLEKRIKSRFEVRIAVDFGLESKESFTGYSANLSTGGLFLETSDTFPVNTELLLNFLLPKTDIHVQCNARVAWVNRLGSLVKPSLLPGMGLQFLNLTQENDTTIQEYLRKEHISRLL